MKAVLCAVSLLVYALFTLYLCWQGRVGEQRNLDWLKHFDVVFTGCSKPKFFTKESDAILQVPNPSSATRYDQMRPDAIRREPGLSVEPRVPRRALGCPGSRPTLGYPLAGGPGHRAAEKHGLGRAADAN